MCGITGIVSDRPVDKGQLQTMTDSLAHRGPDDAGLWFSKNKLAGFGHRRLSIIDLSSSGHQPMVSADSRYAITYNGEIYNYRELKNELTKKGHSFNSSSDTEVLLRAYVEWGQDCLDKLNGMFAFAIWDEDKQELFAARDRLGKKPFKYYQGQNQFIFASELKAILKHPAVQTEIDWQAVDLAFSYRYVPAPRTGFKNIHKLPAGHKLVFTKGQLKIEPYWQARQFAVENRRRSYQDWKQELWSVFKDSVEKRLISDVPVGAFLSGGLDSSSVVVAMTEVSSSPVRTYSVGFKDRPDSETGYAKLVADKYQTEHTEIIIDPQVMEVLPQLIRQYEEPFFDNSAVPTLVMSEMTKRHVTVVLTGDGADECLGGYPNHWFYQYLTSYQKLPKFIYQSWLPKLAQLTQNKKLAYRAELLSHPLAQAYLDYYGIWQRELKKTRYYVSKDDLYSEQLQARINNQLSEELMTSWLETDQSYGAMNRSMLADIQSRLADGYLVKVDLASMTYALENRAPFLDYRFVELCLALPQEYKVRKRQPKLIWKDIMKDKLPTEIVKRKKMGFGIPIATWMQNEIYDQVRDRLLSSQVIGDNFKKEAIERLLKDHKDGKADYSNHLWSLLLLSHWADEFFYG